MPSGRGRRSRAAGLLQWPAMATDPQLTQQIVDAIRGGDRSAFDALFQRVGGKVYVYIYNKMGQRLRRVVEPEDVLQEVYATAYASFDDFVSGGSGSMARWLIGIARNHIRHLYVHHFEHEKRDPRRVVPIAGATASAAEIPLESDTPTPSRVIARDEEVRRLATALEALAPEDRTAILQHFEGESMAAIAERAGVPRTTMLYRVSNALKQLGGLMS